MPLEPTPTLAPLSDTQRRQIFDEVWTLVRNRYLYEDYGGTDWDALRVEFAPQIDSAADPAEFYGLMRTMIDRLGDEHSRFQSPQEVAAQESSFNGELRYGGIGAVVRTTDEGGLIISLAPEGPAARAGLQPRDLIVAINAKPFNDPDLFGPDGPIGEVRGLPGTTVVLTIRSPGQPDRDLNIIREAIPSEVFNRVVAERVAPDIALLTLPSFYVDSVDEQVRTTITQTLQEGPLRGLIIDVRTNSGGFVHLMRNTIALFQDGGDIGSTSGRTQQERQVIPTGRIIPELAGVPIVVLSSPETASAAEMFAAGMQVLGRARIVGMPSAGNTENLYSYTFEDGSRLLLAEVAYRLPSGELIEGRGVIPDRQVDVEWWRYTPMEDPQILAALEELQVPAR
jgi:carboxyl-terminal processing protease